MPEWWKIIGYVIAGIILSALTLSRLNARTLLFRGPWDGDVSPEENDA